MPSTRAEVLRQLKSALQQSMDREHVMPAFWAFCQAADIPKLKHLTDWVKDCKDDSDRKELFDSRVTLCGVFLQTCHFRKYAGS
jgi:hypothetical protein